jgi:hypothetical protein
VKRKAQSINTSYCIWVNEGLPLNRIKQEVALRRKFEIAGIIEIKGFQEESHRR